jgi:TRAP-type C4-dicarboxylate transport system permease small subunit
MGMIQRGVNLVDRFVFTINIFSMITFFIIMGIGVCGVALRILGKPITGITNMSELLLVVGIYMGIAYTQHEKKHVAMELIVSRLRGNHKRILEFVNLVIALIILGIVQIACWDYAIKSWQLKEQMDGAPFYPIYPAKITVGIGFTALWIQVLADLLRVIKKHR